jgi:hypothetical protein
VLCNHRESLIVEIEPSTFDSLPQILQLMAFTYVDHLLCYVENISQLLNCHNASGCKFVRSMFELGLFDEICNYLGHLICEHSST